MLPVLSKYQLLGSIVLLPSALQKVKHFGSRQLFSIPPTSSDWIKSDFLISSNAWLRHELSKSSLQTSSISCPLWSKVHSINMASSFLLDSFHYSSILPKIKCCFYIISSFPLLIPKEYNTSRNVPLHSPSTIQRVLCSSYLFQK